MLRHPFVCLVLALCLTAGLGFAQAPAQAATPSAPAEKTPTLDEVLARFLEASGGRSAFEKLNSFVANGTFETMGNVMQAELGDKMPEKWYFNLKMGDSVVYSQFSNGAQGWVIDQNGTQAMTDDQRTATAAMVDVRFPARIREHFPKLSLKGPAKSEGRDTWLVEGETKAGTAVSMYFDAQTGLLVEIDLNANTPNGAVHIQNFLEDYRDVNGVKSAFLMRQTGANDWTLKTTEVKYNVEIPDSKFENTTPPTTPKP